MTNLEEIRVKRLDVQWHCNFVFSDLTAAEKTKARGQCVRLDRSRPQVPERGEGMFPRGVTICFIEHSFWVQKTSEFKRLGCVCPESLIGVGFAYFPILDPSDIQRQPGSRSQGQIGEWKREWGVQPTGRSARSRILELSSNHPDQNFRCVPYGGTRGCTRWRSGFFMVDGRPNGKHTQTRPGTGSAIQWMDARPSFGGTYTAWDSLTNIQFWAGVIKEDGERRVSSDGRG